MRGIKYHDFETSGRNCTSSANCLQSVCNCFCGRRRHRHHRWRPYSNQIIILVYYLGRITVRAKLK